ncbi:hypothetical protein [Chryseobacterium limigenitum]|uniref:DUF5050 domain-containing protein n=1 Tax=Chryseobacterium limigenitum TaxID=1612149 RepID=A0A1K2IJQ0_9FLAO|nr:hypothetical protein [Chryseobacterium limigenitum]SFZ92526.1 hypothetical protein SAMN05216324_103304 [Chryseobacterium limigenitum]
MNIRKILTLAFAATLLFNVSCSNDSDDVVLETTFENGILITNEGGFTTPTAEVSFVTNDLSALANKIYSGKNNEVLGNVLQTIGFDGNNAYLVSNVPNKIDIVNRYTFKKQATVTTNLQNPRYIAFSGNQYYVTNNNFFDVMKLNVYNKDNSFVKSISFARSAEKVVEANGNIVVQTDGVTYESTPPYSELPTGYTITIVKASTNVVDKTVTLPSNGIIRDLISYNGDAYVLASDNTNSYIYKINSTTGAYTTTTLTAIPQAQKLRIDANKFYFTNSSNKIYSMTVGSTTVPTTPIVTTTGNLYGFNVIDGKIFASDASFTADSKVNVYNATNGSLLKTFTTGIGTNGFYKN